MLSKKVLTRIALNSFLGLALVFVWSRFVNFSGLLSALKSARLELFALFFPFFIASSVLRSLRLKALLHKFSLPAKDLIFLGFLASLLSFLIPIRAGEVSKSVYLTTQRQIPLVKSVIWVLLDRFLDFWTNLALVGIFLLAVKTTLPGNFSTLLFLAFAAFSLAALAVILAPGFSSRMVELLARLLVVEGVKSRVLKLAGTVIDGFEVLRRRPGELVWLLGLSTAALISDALMWYYVLSSLGVNLAFVPTFLGSLLSALTFLVPAAPGYVGSAEASTLAVFSGVLGLPANLSSAAAVLYHILAAIALLSTGIISLYSLKFDLKLVWKQFRKR